MGMVHGPILVVYLVLKKEARLVLVKICTGLGVGLGGLGARGHTRGTYFYWRFTVLLYLGAATRRCVANLNTMPDQRHVRILSAPWVLPIHIGLVKLTSRTS